MGTIIHLNPPQRAASPVVAGEPLPTCEIVIFPGVRIERQAAPTDEAPEPHTDRSTGHGGRPRKSS
jgi:hypothetical protein